MKKRFALVLALALAGCSTAQVQTTCADAQKILAAATPFLSIAPIEVRAAITAIGAGTVGCQTAEYAALRERVVSWLKGLRR